MTNNSIIHLHEVLHYVLCPTRALLLFLTICSTCAQLDKDLFPSQNVFVVGLILALYIIKWFTNYACKLCIACGGYVQHLFHTIKIYVCQCMLKLIPSRRACPVLHLPCSVRLWSNFQKRDFHHPGTLINGIFWSISESVSSCTSNYQSWLTSFLWCCCRAGVFTVPSWHHLIPMLSPRLHLIIWGDSVYTFPLFCWTKPQFQPILQPISWKNHIDSLQEAKTVLLVRWI